MTILSTTSRMSYTGNGAASNYSFTYKIFNEEDLLVTVRHPTTGVETELTLTTDYTVTIASNGTGSIDLVDADQAWLTGAFLTTAWVLVIRRVVDLTQETDIRNQGAFFPENHEDAFDYMTMISQQLKDEVDRSLKIAETDNPLTLKLPTSTERASQFLAFDADGEPIASAAVSEYPVSSYMQTVLDDTTAADARTTLGFTGTGGTAATANIEDLAVTIAKLDASIVNDATTVVAAQNDYALIADTSDSGNIKKALVSDFAPSGVIFPFAGSVAPTGYLLCDGSHVSRSTYANLFTAIGEAYGEGDGSTTFALPDTRGVFLRGLMAIADATGSGTAASDNGTFTAHGFNRTGIKVRMASGTLSGLSTATDYWTIIIDANTLAFAASYADALAGTKIAISGANSAVITQYVDPDASSRTAQDVGGNTGLNVGSVQADQLKSHTHNILSLTAGAAGGSTITLTTGGTPYPSNTSTGGNETRPINLYVNHIIKV